MRVPHTRRAAFTLIELLVVISIIAILVSLLVVATIRIIRKGPEVTTRTEIGQLEVGINNAKQGLNVPYLPSSIVLREDCNYNMSSPAEVASVRFLQKAFGKRIPITKLPAGQFIDWNGNGALDPNPVTLTGHKALVFWLGGIPNVQNGNAGCLGFCTDPINPASGSGTRTPPYFEFKNNRLVADTDGFLYYKDAFNTAAPYAYFSTYGSANSYQAGDCAGIPGGPVAPYSVSGTSNPVQFINPNGFQIISAGNNGMFGPGGAWNTSSGYPPNSPGADDMANFSGSILGAGQN